MYLTVLLLFLVKFKKINNTTSVVLITLIFTIKNNLIKKINDNKLNLNQYSNSFWDYILILNNNNRSLLLFFFLIYFFFYFRKIFLNFKGFVLLFFFFNIYLTNYKFDSIKSILLNFNTINSGLINGLILIHPLFMYISYIFLIVFIKKINFKKINKTILLYKNNHYLFSFLSLFLGSYWSQQELNWGGWWNWDFVELIALVFFLLYNSIIHLNFSKNINFLKNLIWKITNYLVLFFFIIRLDFINSIHSFNSFNKTNFNLNILLYIYVIFIIIVFVLNKNNYNKYYKNIKNVNAPALTFLMFLFIFIIYIYLNIILSFFYDIQYIELTKYLKNILNILIFNVFLIFSKNTYLFYTLILIKYLFISILLINLIVIKIINNYKYNCKNIFHIFTIIFIIINNFYYNYQFNLINLNSFKTNLSLLNNLNILDYFKNNLIYLSYYNNNNCLLINNYYCYNNNILFNNVFKETLLNNILLLNKKTKIVYNLDKNFLIYNYNNLYLYLYFIYLFLFVLGIQTKINKLKII